MSEGNTMRKATTTTPATTSAAPDPWGRLAAPFAAEEVRSRRGPRGDMRYITARVARRRLNDVLGPANWSCRIEPGDRWVRCCAHDHLARRPRRHARSRRRLPRHARRGGPRQGLAIRMLSSVHVYCSASVSTCTATSRPSRGGRRRHRPPTATAGASRGTSRATASASPTPRVLRLAQGQRPPRPRRGDRGPRGLPGTGRKLDTRTDQCSHPGNPRADAHRPLNFPATPGPESPGPGRGGPAG